MSLTTFIMDISVHSVTCFASTPAGCSRYFYWTLPIRANAESKKKKRQPQTNMPRTVTRVELMRKANSKYRAMSDNCIPRKVKLLT